MTHSPTHRRLAATRSLAVAAVTAAAALCALGAHAGPQPLETPATSPGVVVRYADLNLKTAQGNQVLYGRLSTAASHVCGDQPDLRDLNAMHAYHACYDAALERAVRKVDSPRLQALYAVHAGAHSVG